MSRRRGPEIERKRVTPRRSDGPELFLDNLGKIIEK
jgi:hypothetical protein